MLLSTRNLRLQGPRKLHDRFVGPFQVTERIGPTAYRLDLSGGKHRQALRGIHDVFHVSLLKHFKDNRMVANVPPVEIDEHEEYEIELHIAYCLCTWCAQKLGWGIWFDHPVPIDLLAYWLDGLSFYPIARCGEW